jgi:prepilin-type processing-associated H-X9-DG protein
MSDTKQILLGARMYTEDNRDVLPPNDYPQNGNAVNIGTRNWVVGTMLNSASTLLGEQTNTSIIIDPRFSSLALYVKSAGVFHCPADHSTYKGENKARSMSMNCAIGTKWTESPRGATVAGWYLDAGTYTPATTFRTYGKMSDMTKPGPSDLWILMDEHPDSINDPLMCVVAGTNNLWVDFPASYHNGAGSISYADGHSEIHKWLESFTKNPPHAGTGVIINNQRDTTPGGSRDLAYLRDRSSAPR